MRKNKCLHFLKEIMCVFIVFLIFTCILNNNYVYGDASGTSGGGQREAGGTYTELESLIEELEKNPELASSIYTNLSTADTSTTRPNRDLSGDDYNSNMAKWAAVVLIPDMDRSENVKDNLSDLSGLSNRDISSSQYKKAYDLINDAMKEYDETIENGGTKNDALKNAGNYVANTATQKAEQDVEDAKNYGVTTSGKTQSTSNNSNNTTNNNSSNNSSNPSTLDDIIQSGNDFLNAADDSMNTIDEGDLQGLSKFISGVLLSIAIGVTVISGVVLGIKFVTQSIEDKAKIKEAMVPWIIGIMVSFGAFTIWEITINFFQNM